MFLHFVGIKRTMKNSPSWNHENLGCTCICNFWLWGHRGNLCSAFKKFVSPFPGAQNKNGEMWHQTTFSDQALFYCAFQNDALPTRRYAPRILLLVELEAARASSEGWASCIKNVPNPTCQQSETRMPRGSRSSIVGQNWAILKCQLSQLLRILRGLT
jgi:hypothetical protein